MPNPVSLVTVHHEGAGSCTNDPARYRDGGYTYGIGCSNWTRLRDVWSSYATLNFNHQSLDVCISGNRMTQAVTSSDVELIRQAVANARSLGYVVNNPTVRAHRNSPGSSTVCPGDRTMDVWSQIVAACQGGAAPGPGPTPPQPPATQGAPLTVVASPKGSAGRVGTARPIPAFGTVALDNGARCQGDAPSGAGFVWVNPDKTVQDIKAPLIDIAATVDGNGRPDGRGFVALYDLKNGTVGTYVVPWR